MKTYQQARWAMLVIAALVSASAVAGDEGSLASRTADAIRREALHPTAIPRGCLCH